MTATKQQIKPQLATNWENIKTLVINEGETNLSELFCAVLFRRLLESVIAHSYEQFSYANLSQLVSEVEYLPGLILSWLRWPAAAEAGARDLAAH